MKRLISVMTAVLMVVGAAHATGGTVPKKPGGDTIKINNNVDSSQVQKVYVATGDTSATARGGDATSISQGGGCRR